MDLTSDSWDQLNGICKKHGIPSIPCRRCLLTKDPGVHLIISKSELEKILRLQISLKDLLPTDQRWLTERVTGVAT